MNRINSAGTPVAERPAAAGAPVLDKTVASFLRALAKKGGKPFNQLPYEEARKALDSVQSSVSIAKRQARIEDLAIPGGPTGTIAVRIVRPESSVAVLPIVMYFHGGGWVLGDRETHDRLIREIANGAEAAVVFVNYTPSPEVKFPVPLEEAYSATTYFAEHGAGMGLDPSRLAVAGDSVGGNMATLVALLAKERGGPDIVHQVLFYPVTDAAMDTPSYRQFAEGPWLTKAAMAWFWDAYAPGSERRDDPYLSPLRASHRQLAGLPPALVITDENDVLRDEGEAYARKLLEAGVDVTAIRVLGTIHDFVMLNALADSPATRSAIGIANAHLKSAFTV